MISSDEMVKHFRLSVNQYMTIDKNKHESFGTLIQGFFALKEEENIRIIPFMLVSPKDIDKLEEIIKTFKTDFLVFRWVQHYIHYNYA